jgi:hypothetical protein
MNHMIQRPGMLVPQDLDGHIAALAQIAMETERRESG